MTGNSSGNLFFSIILAFRNEADFLEECLRSFDNQSLTRNEWEIILVDGQSNDGSEKIAREYCEQHDNSEYVTNPKKLAAAGWNIGVRLSSGKYYFPASGHAVIDKDFLKEAKIFFKKNADVHALGGRVISMGINSASKAIAAASNTPFGMGGVYYRIGTTPRRVNVVGLGIYSRHLYLSIGPYLHDFVRSGDWEFNYRAWVAGFKMYINPAMKSQLYVRSNFRRTFLQQFITGFWKIRVWEIHPRSLLLRHMIPPLFVLWLLASPFFIFFGWTIFFLWLFPSLIYLMLSIFSAFKVSDREHKWHLIILSYPVIHLAYGMGFLVGLLSWCKKRLFREKRV
jgi:glycosyltransferase involved in cell wall biosynthesis